MKKKRDKEKKLSKSNFFKLAQMLRNKMVELTNLFSFFLFAICFFDLHGNKDITKKFQTQINAGIQITQMNNVSRMILRLRFKMDTRFLTEVD